VRLHTREQALTRDEEYTLSQIVSNRMQEVKQPLLRLACGASLKIAFGHRSRQCFVGLALPRGFVPVDSGSRRSGAAALLLLVGGGHAGPPYSWQFGRYVTAGGGHRITVSRLF
jgi:hypothetical protein